MGQVRLPGSRCVALRFVLERCRLGRRLTRSRFWLITTLFGLLKIHSSACASIAEANRARWSQRKYLADLVFSCASSDSLGGYHTPGAVYYRADAQRTKCSTSQFFVSRWSALLGSWRRLSVPGRFWTTNGVVVWAKVDHPIQCMGREVLYFGYNDSQPLCPMECPI